MDIITHHAARTQIRTRLASLERLEIVRHVQVEPERLSKSLFEIVARTENWAIERISMGRLRKVIRQFDDPLALKRFLQKMREDVASGRRGTLTLMAAGADGFNYLTEPSAATRARPTHQKSDRILFYLPGGGFILPTSPHQRRRIAALAKDCRATAIIAEPRLAPEHGFPIPVHDLLSHYRQILGKYASQTQGIFVGADTAGASVMMGMMQLARQENLPLPQGIILFSPWGDLALSGWSYLTKSATMHSPFRMEMAAFCAKLYLGDHPTHDPLASFIHAPLEGFPPISIHTSRNDVHFDDAVKLAENARNTNIPVELHYWDSARHHLERLGHHAAEKTVELTKAFMDNYSLVDT